MFGILWVSRGSCFVSFCHGRRVALFDVDVLRGCLCPLEQHDLAVSVRWVCDNIEVQL